MNKKEHQTEVLRKSTQPKHHQQFSNPRDVIDQSLREQLKKRQHVIQKIYKRSVVNKLYIFPKEQEDIDNISFRSNQSIEEMNGVERYKLSSQNHQSNATIKNNVNYFSQSVISNEHEQSKPKIDLRKYKTKYSSNKKLNQSQSIEKIVYSGRVNPQKLLFKSSMSKKKQQFSNSLNKQQKGKSYCSIYQEILNKVAIKVDRQSQQKSNSSNSALKKTQFTYRKTKPQNISTDSIKDKFKIIKQPAHNISVSKILQKYKSSNKKKSERCRTQY